MPADLGQEPLRAVAYKGNDGPRRSEERAVEGVAAVLDHIGTIAHRIGLDARNGPDHPLLNQEIIADVRFRGQRFQGCVGNLAGIAA